MFDNFFDYLSDQSHQGPLAFFAIVISWLIYRLGVWAERDRVLLSLSKELELHGSWLSSSYEDGKVLAPWKEKSYVVFKLSTVAVDNAIVVGPSLFLNSSLIESLVGYRQRINQFNQLIDSAMTYQANSGLWQKENQGIEDDRMTMLTGLVHWYGIGVNNPERPFGHFYYLQVRKEIESERSSIFLPIVWFLTGFNFFKFKKWFCKYL